MILDYFTLTRSVPYKTGSAVLMVPFDARALMGLKLHNGREFITDSYLQALIKIYVIEFGFV